MIHPSQTTATFKEIADEIAKSSSSSNARERIFLDLCCCALTGLISPGNLGWNVDATLRLRSDDWRPKVGITRLPTGTVVRPASGPSIPDGTILLDERQPTFLEVTPEIIVDNLANSMGALGPITRDLFEEHGANAAPKLADHFKLHGLPHEGDCSRPLIECLALSKAGVREFCESAGWAIPKWAAASGAAAKDCSAAYLEGPPLARPNGYISIPVARAAIWRRRYPNEAHCLRLTDDGRLPGSFAEASTHLHEGEPKLLGALTRHELRGVVMLENGQLLELDARYWESDGARFVTLEQSTLHAPDGSLKEWHGRPVYIAEVEFWPWLDREYGPNKPVPLSLLEALERYSDPDDWRAFMKIESKFVAKGYAPSVAAAPVLYVGRAPAGYLELAQQRSALLAKLETALRATLRSGRFKITGLQHRPSQSPIEAEIPPRQLAIANPMCASSAVRIGDLLYEGVEIREVEPTSQEPSTPDDQTDQAEAVAAEAASASGRAPMAPDDTGPYLTFGQLYRWLAYGSPSKDALGTISRWMRAQFANWKEGHNIQPVKARSVGDPSPAKIGVAEMIQTLGWPVDEFAKTFRFDSQVLQSWIERKVVPEGHEYHLLLGIQRAIEALSKDPERLASAGDEIGRKAEEGLLKVFGRSADNVRLQAIPPIDFNRSQFDFHPIDDEADLVVMANVLGGKKKVILWHRLRFERGSVLASLPKLMGGSASESKPDLQSTQDVATATQAEEPPRTSRPSSTNEVGPLGGLWGDHEGLPNQAPMEPALKAVVQAAAKETTAHRNARWLAEFRQLKTMNPDLRDKAIYNEMSIRSCGKPTMADMIKKGIQRAREAEQKGMGTAVRDSRRQ